ncbi:hypothetical protein GOODEAATRI_003469 [Goodea atripinnis]|uniref:DUF3456 domain-containing protein n=1 Tax=Goodea atripinnis TaxID=208336 RepID=A0ABV0NH59_9TELE
MCSHFDCCNTSVLSLSFIEVAVVTVELLESSLPRGGAVRKCSARLRYEGRCSPARILCSCVSPPRLQPSCQTRTRHQMWRYPCVLFISSHNKFRQFLMSLCFAVSSACRALVDEMEWAISQVDPKKMIQTGSFRINPDGSQSIREVRLHINSHLVVHPTEEAWM